MDPLRVVPRPTAVHVVPRRCRGADVTPYATPPADPTKKTKIIITLHEIETLLHLSSPDAALSLGISVTALKRACRLLGIPRWPYSRWRTSDSKSSPPTIDSMYPLWDSESWDPYAGTHPVCPPANVPDLCFDEVSGEGCDLCFLAFDEVSGEDCDLCFRM